MVLFASHIPFQGQVYSKLKKDCVKVGTKFSDPKFLPQDESLFFSRQPPGVVTWKRPHEIVQNPKLFVEGVSSQDVTQGYLGNCWFVAACASLTGVKDLWKKVIPDHKEQEYCDGHPGIFHFRFWRFGQWVDVVIDDLLPTIGGELIFTHSREKAEFWCALLEKAYAKVNGSYEALEGGNLSDALVDLSSGVSAHLELATGGYATDFEKRTELFKMMLKEKGDGALMSCAIAPHSHEEAEMRTSSGLIKGHAYSITALKKVNLSTTSSFQIFRGNHKVRMVRLKNPWGEKEWNGAFSDGSPEWSKVSSSEREKLGLVFEDDGEFWMTFEDFVNNFTDLSICFLINTSFLSFGKTWHEAFFSGSWTIGVKGHSTDRSGGCPNNKESFLRNPQYRFDVKEDVDDVIFQLMQRDTRQERKQGIMNLVIGFHIMKVELNRIYRVHRTQEAVATSDYIRTRSIFLREQMKKGRYVLVPTTFKPDESGDFILRVFTSKSADAKELLLDEPKVHWYSCFRSPVMVTTVTVKCAAGLDKHSSIDGAPDSYCIIKCEGQSVRTPTAKKTVTPSWDVTAIFYRKKPASPVVVEVWNSNLLVDGFIGRAEVLAPVNPNKVQVEVPLVAKGKGKDTETGAVLTVQVYSDDDLQSV